MSDFWQLSFDLEDRDPASSEACCFALGALAVTLVDAGDEPVLEPLPGEVRLWSRTLLRALFPDRDDPRPWIESLGQALNVPYAAIRLERLADRPWEREWLRDFHAMCFGRRLWICPRHEQVSEPGAAIVRLDPGLAFGTGTHPSTAICLRWLDAHLRPGSRLIDFGCGSGILALAAIKLGASEAHCFDIDPQALLATGENAEANGLRSRIVVCEEADELPHGVDLLVSNILSGPLRALAPKFAALVREGGSVVLAGLLAADSDDVSDAYNTWFDMNAFESREGWTGLSGVRNCRPPTAPHLQPFPQ